MHNYVAIVEAEVKRCGVVLICPGAFPMVRKQKMREMYGSVETGASKNEELE